MSPKSKIARPVFTQLQTVDERTVRFIAEGLSGAYIEVSLLEDGSGVEVRTHPDGLVVRPHVSNLVSVKLRRPEF